VVICCYTEERTEQVIEAAESVGRQSLPALETIIVCDHNPALEAHLRAVLPECRLVANEEARGLSGARNSGARVANGGVVAFLDDDAVAGDDWLAHLMDPFADSRVAVVGGTVDPIWESGRPGWFPDEFGWVVGYSHRGVPTQTSIVRNPFGGNMAIRVEALQAIGGFRSGIGRVGTRPVGGEETDVCIRLLRTRPDALVVFEPRARIAHHVPARRTTMRYFVARCYHEGISKAQLAAFSGADRALSEERHYVRKILPGAVARGVLSALGGRVADGLGRAGAVVAGVSAAGAGYVRQSVADELQR
jgi:cellulose synthase/poly-beta-1,6-N-acetylglucosamine synthase-like glycosyltransferase